MLNRELFIKTITALAEIFDKEYSELYLNVYYNAVKHLSDEEFIRAVNYIIASRTFYKMPLPAELLAVVKGSPEDAALIALEKVERAIKEIGGYSSVIFDDPVIHRVIHALGGWIAVCSMHYEEWKWTRQDFLKMYQVFMDKDDIPTPKKLYGKLDLENEAHGYIKDGLIKEFVQYVGNKNKAIEWTDKQRALQENQKILIGG